MLAHRLSWLPLALLCGCTTEPYVAVPLDPDRVPAERAAARLDDAAALDGWSCARLGAIAVSRAPAVRAAAAAVAASEAAVAVAGQRTNPTVNLALDYNSDIDPGDDSHFSGGPTIDLVVPRGNRRRIRTDLASAEVVMAQAALAAARWDARDAVCRAAAELDAARRHRALALVRQETLTAAAALARSAVEAGLGDAFEWQTLQLEATAARLASLAARRALEAARARFAGRLQLSLAAVQDIAFARWTAPVVPALTTLQDHALRHHPAIAAAVAGYDRAEHELELAVAAQYPDIELSPGYLFEQGDNVLSLLGGLVVPLFATQHAPIAAAAARRDHARATFEQVQAEVLAAVAESWAGWSASNALLSEATAVRSAIAAGVEETRAARRLGLADTLMVRRAEVQLADVDLELAAAVRDRQLAALALERAVAQTFADERFSAAAPTAALTGADLP